MPNDKVFYKGRTYEELYKYVREDHEPSLDLWFLTFTLNPKTFKFSAITQYDMTINEVRSILDTWTYQYSLTVELTETGNIHYHAIAKIPDKLTRIRIIEKTKRKKVLGFICINKVPVYTEEMLTKACNYIIKELDKTTEVVRRPNYKPDMLFIKNMR